MGNSRLLINEINSDIDLRLLEIRQIKNISNNLGDVQNKLFLKGCILVLYSHWEGFAKLAIFKTIKHINSLKLKTNDFCFNYITYSYEKDLISLENSTNFAKRKKHIKEIYNHLIENSLQINTNIDTKSNLNFNVLGEVCNKINVNLNDNFVKNYKDDLNTLVKIRNHIAHGDGGDAYSFKDFQSIEKYIDLLENLMIDFTSLIEDLINNKNYKRVNNNEKPI